MGNQHMTRPSPLSIPDHPRQRGVALLTALIFLVVLTLLGIGVYSTTTSEEKMARNFRDKEIALQAAEAAINEAKILITGSFLSGGTQRYPLSDTSCYSSTSVVGFSCDPTLNAATLDLFSGSVTGAPLNQIGSDSPAITGVVSQPRYLVSGRTRLFAAQATPAPASGSSPRAAGACRTPGSISSNFLPTEHPPLTCRRNAPCHAT